MADDFFERVAAALGGASDADIKRAYAEISDRYRSSPAGGLEPLTADEAAAYALVRSPATFAAAREVFKRIRIAAPDFAPKTLLDVGAGIGTSTWAAAEAFPSLQAASLVEHAPEMLRLGKAVAHEASVPLLRDAQWLLGDVGRLPHDDYEMAIASYVLGEIPLDRRASAMDRWWDQAETLVVIEPGTPEGFERIIEVRESLRRAGASLLAPCPHERLCPMAGRDWCHFSVRLQRTRIHRAVKGGALGFEDEKFSYVVASKSKQRVDPSGGRIVRHPMIRSGHKTFEVCTPDGEIEKETISRRQGEMYKAARRLGWGDELPGTPEQRADL